ncbi:tetratricopeptide repeat protein [Haloferula sp. BvORR071]|uniref:TPR end-of-group domain-containing protein n=1 Tax=Haloferula sp. BvORR071 TaxID=1396141 RepID=UPI0005599CF4|nr:tetratricopeptide repeat protein [Haloferula sp. BvORR071]
MSYESDAAVQRATGFLELGLAEEALSELDDLPPPLRQESLILHLRVDAYFRMKRWAEAAEICVPKLETEASDVAWWIQAGYALRRSASLTKAEETLCKALEFHPKHSLIHYNLACYACVDGREEEARERLVKATEEDVDLYLKMAKDDPDLVRIRPWVIAWQAQRREQLSPQ